MQGTRRIAAGDVSQNRRERIKETSKQKEGDGRGQTTGKETGNSTEMVEGSPGSHATGTGGASAGAIKQNSG